MEHGEQSYLRLVRPDEGDSLEERTQADEAGGLHDGIMLDGDRARIIEDGHELDRFAPVGIQAVLKAGIAALLTCMRNLEIAHRDILTDPDYKKEKVIATALADKEALDFEYVQEIFYWLYGAVAGYFDQMAEQYELCPQRGVHNQGSAKNYLPGTFDDLLKGVFVVAKARYYQEAISAAAALIICGELPAGLRQVVNAWREAVLRKVIITIRQTNFVSGGREVSCMNGFRYQQDREILAALRFPNEELAAYLGKCETPREKAVVLAIFAVRAAVTASCATDSASRIANLTPLSIVR